MWLSEKLSRLISFFQLTKNKMRFQIIVAAAAVECPCYSLNWKCFLAVEIRADMFSPINMKI